MIDIRSRPERSQSLELVSDGRGTLLRTPEGRSLARLNDTSAALWELCDGHTEIAEILQAVRDLLGRDDVTDGVVQAIDEMTRRGVLVLKNST